MQRTQSFFRRGGVKKGVFHKAEHEDLARPMLEAVGWPLLAAFSVTMEDSDNKPRVLLCMEGVRLGIHLTKALGMETMRYAFLTSLVRYCSWFCLLSVMMRIKVVELNTYLRLCTLDELLCFCLYLPPSFGHFGLLWDVLGLPVCIIPT